MNRRRFLAGKAGLLLGSISAPFLLSSYRPRSRQRGNTEANTEGFGKDLEYGIGTLPDFCAHEHWGSIEPIGSAPEQNGYRADTMSGATPRRSVSVWDLLLDPYASSWMRSAGRHPQEAATAAGYKTMIDWWQKEPAPALAKFKELMNSLVITGVYQCTRRGLHHQYGHDIARYKVEDWQQLDTAVQQNYAGIFKWYQRAMTKANFSNLIRPVHPEFYATQESVTTSGEELSFTGTVMRIDPLLDLWKTTDKRREALAAIVGIDPGDAATFRDFIGRVFDLAQKNKASGIKQLQAYRRNFQFQQRNDRDVKFRGDLNAEEATAFQDWVMHECCKQADDRNWAHQIHVGTHNLGQSNPLPLEEISRKYGKMKLVLIHCWPFLNEAGWLAKMRPNIYLDCNWLPVLNPSFLQQALGSWLGYVPTHKIMLSHDSTHIEMATGSSLFVRETLSEELKSRAKKLGLADEHMEKIAIDMLHDNAVRVYGMGAAYRS